MKHCQDWIVHFAGEKSKEELGQPMQPEFNDVLSEYTAYTQKTHGKLSFTERLKTVLNGLFRRNSRWLSYLILLIRLI